MIGSIRLNTPAVALLREYVGRHRWLALGLAVDFAVMVVGSRAIPDPWRAIPAVGLVAAQLAVAFFLGIVAIFSVNATKPKSGQNGYPPRMFLMPVSTARLVAWPMLYGMAAMAIGWAGVATFVLPEFGFRPPLLLGALALAAALAWLQTLGWWPFGSNLTQLLAAGVALPAIGTIVTWPIVVWGWSPATGAALLAIAVLAAFGLSVRGVTLDRRGEGRGGRGWMLVIDRLGGLAERMSSPRRVFDSPARAQLWYEWRSKALGMFVMTAILTLMVTLFVSVLAGVSERWPGQLRGFVAAMLVQPLALCLSMGAAFARDDFWNRAITLSPFTATRPVSSGLLAACKLRASAIGLAASWGFAFLMVPVFLAATGNLGPFAAMVRPLVVARGAGPVVLLSASAIVVVLTATWRAMIGAMLPTMTGRPWVIGAVCLGMLAAGLLAGGFVGLGTMWPPLFPIALEVLPWGLGILLVLKLAASAFCFRAAIGRGIISGRWAIAGTLIWAVGTACGVGLVAAILRPAALGTWLAIAAGSALIPPLGRLAILPLALEWNRHR